MMHKEFLLHKECYSAREVASFMKEAWELGRDGESMTVRKL